MYGPLTWNVWQRPKYALMYEYEYYCRTYSFLCAGLELVEWGDGAKTR